MSDKENMSKYVIASKSVFTFDPLIKDEVTVNIMDETHTLPAVEHVQHDAVTSLIAVVVELHNRVQVLEAELKGQDDE